VNLKKILNETADLLESGKLAWTKNAYIMHDDESFAEVPAEATLDNCSACAIGACALVGRLNGEIKETAIPVHAFETALEDELGARVVGDIIRFNDEYALSAKSVAEKLRTVAGLLPEA